MNRLQDSKKTKTSVQISKQTRLKLAKLGTIASTYDSLINELVNHVTKCDRFWEMKD